uniref:Uncharacterized protein n=1 Tax=Caenorhabditis japonica TaxID=281687 RepID=A0A8R1ET53_CAEJA
MTLSQISDAIQFDSGGMTHLLGGVTLDDDKRIAGAKAMLLPYALRHSSDDEDWVAEKWEVRLADFLLQYDSPIIRASWWTYETLAAESARDRLQLIKYALFFQCSSRQKFGFMYLFQYATSVLPLRLDLHNCMLLCVLLAAFQTMMLKNRQKGKKQFHK